MGGAREAKGGWSRLIRVPLHQLLLGPLAVRRVGIPVALAGGGSVLIFAELCALLSDLDGIRMTMDWMGTSAHKPCMKCSKTWMKGFPCLPGHVDISCSDQSKFTPMTDEVLHGTIDFLLGAAVRFENGEMTQAKFTELQQGFGFRPNPLGLLADEALRRVINFSKLVRTDWVHNELQSGVFQADVQGFTQACATVGLTFNVWEQILKSDWCFPRARECKASNLHSLFNRWGLEHSEEKHKFKCKASDLLGLFAVMRHVCEVRFAGTHDLEIKS